MIYDVIVAGAGPSGLMAAKTAAAKGLTVLLIERKQQVSVVRRACCSHFVMEEGYENEALRVADGKIVSPKNDFEVAYAGKTIDFYKKCFYSPQGNKILFAAPDANPIGIKFEKEKLLQGLLRECERLGVHCMPGTGVCGAEDAGKQVAVQVTCRGAKSEVCTKKLLIADGVNSRTAAALGFNEGRKKYLTGFVIKYTVAGYHAYEPHSWNFYFGKAYHSHAAVLVGPSFYGADTVEVTIMGGKSRMPDTIFGMVTADSPLSKRFQGVTVLDRQACSLKACDSIKNPHKGNVLVVGDAAAYIEVEVQGALMCGYHAGNAVARELDGHNGFTQYASWWQQSFEFNSDDYLKVAQGYALVPAYTDDELDYLFALVGDEVLQGTFSQYTTPGLLWASILRHKDRISAERPELYEKVKKIGEMSLSASFAGE
ncbi:NAD(P)/FAD-dependent oxidoreductase [Thermodesulfobacteriota bacterium]